MAGRCICGKGLVGLALVSEGTCHWCGHGACPEPKRVQDRPPRLPRDLGALQRIGGRIPLHFDNTAHLDRLRNLREMAGLA